MANAPPAAGSRWLENGINKDRNVKKDVVKIEERQKEKHADQV